MTITDEEMAGAMTLLKFLGKPATPEQVEQKFLMGVARIKADQGKDPEWERRHHMDTRAMALTLAVLHLVHGEQPSRSEVETEWRRSLVAANKYLSTRTRSVFPDRQPQG